MAIAAYDMPNYRRPEVVAAEPDLELVSDLLAGTRRMHEKSTKYVRKWASEDNAVYDIRRRIEKVYEGLGRVLSASVGMLFAKAPTLEWNQSEAAMKEHWTNVDSMGTAGPVFVKRFTELGVRDGLVVGLVDHTTPPTGTVVTASNETELGLRPVWAMYERCQAVSWRVAKLNGEITLTQLVLKECAEVEVGRFGVEPEVRYRELRMLNGMATWRLWRAVKANPQQGSDFQMIGGGFFKNRSGEIAKKLPVRVATCGRSDSMLVASIPLLGVAWANLHHWLQSSNLRFYRDLCAFPQPTVVGVLAMETTPQGVTNPGKLRIGPMVAVQLNEGGEFKWTELTGTSMVQIQQGIQEAEQHMSQLGMSFLVKDTRAAETAEAKRLDSTAENSTLATAATGIEDATNGMLEDHAWYLGIEKEGAPVLTLNRDYDNTAMDAPTMLAYVTAIEKAGLPVRTLLEAWKAGGRLPPDTDIDALELEMMTNIAAKQAEAQAQADAAAKQQPAAA